MRLFLALLLFLPISASAIDIVRQGDLVVIKANCYAFNLATFNQKIPEGVTTLNQILLIAAASQRDLTPEELSICTGDPIVLPSWKVHDNGNITRPAYTLSAGLLVKDSRRATIGELCGAFALPVANTTKREYRYLVSAPKLVAICEYK